MRKERREVREERREKREERCARSVGAAVLGRGSRLAAAGTAALQRTRVRASKSGMTTPAARQGMRPRGRRGDDGESSRSTIPHGPGRSNAGRDLAEDSALLLAGPGDAGRVRLARTDHHQDTKTDDCIPLMLGVPWCLGGDPFLQPCSSNEPTNLANRRWYSAGSRDKASRCGVPSARQNVSRGERCDLDRIASANARRS